MDLFLMNGLNGIEDKGVQCYTYQGVGQWAYADELASQWLSNWNPDSNTFSGQTGQKTIQNSFNIGNDQNSYIKIMSAYIKGDNGNHVFSIQNVDDLCLVYVNDVLYLKADYWSPTGGAEKGAKQSNTVFLKNGQNSVVVVYVNRGGGASCSFKLDDANTDTYTWYQYSGGIARDEQIKAQQTAEEQARIKAEQDAINAKQAETDKINKDIELEKIKLEQLKLGGKVGGTSTGGPYVGTNNLFLYGGIAIAFVGVLALFVFKKKKRK